MSNSLRAITGSPVFNVSLNSEADAVEIIEKMKNDIRLANEKDWAFGLISSMENNPNC